MKITCVCPPRADGTPRHPEDDVVLRERLDFAAVNATKNALAMMYIDDPDAGMPDILAVIHERYILHGIESWSLVDENGEPLTVTKGAIRDLILSRPEVAETIAEAADDLYQEAVMRPLFRMASTSSPSTSTTDSTSPTTDSSGSFPTRPSSPSSTSITPTDDTATTDSSPDGDSSSSPRWASVA